jgi:hypothetical protein
MQKKVIFTTILIIASLVGCAKRSAPPGGPEDKATPLLTSSTPANRAVSVPVDSTLRFVFDERLKEDAAAFASYPKIEYSKIVFSNRTISVKLSKPLRQNTTYTVLFTGKLGDLHGNFLTVPVSICFSTGETLDSLSVSGTVVDGEALEPVKNAFVAVMSEGEILRATFADNTGSFIVGNLPFKKIDIYASSKIQSDSMLFRADKIGKLDGVSLPHTGALTIAIFKNDSVAPSVLNYTLTDSFTALFKFDEKLKVQSLSGLDDFSIWLMPQDSTSLYIGGAHTIAGKEIELSFCDYYGNCKTQKFMLTGTVPIDTTPPLFAGKRGLEKLLPGENAAILFNEWVNPVFKAFVRDTQVAISQKRTAPNRFEIHFETEQAGAKIKISIDSLCDKNGNCLQDTVYFTVLQDKLGELVLKTTNNCPNQKYFVVSGANKIYYIPFKDGAYRKFIPADNYSLWRFCDSDSNGMFDYGSVKNKIDGEKLEMYPNQISVRAGWDSEINW